MKREITLIHTKCSTCCPGHDNYPNDTYRNRRSKKQRALLKSKEHREVRRQIKLHLKTMLK